MLKTLAIFLSVFYNGMLYAFSLALRESAYFHYVDNSGKSALSTVDDLGAKAELAMNHATHIARAAHAAPNIPAFH